jgi:hypothetical protein
MTTNLRSLRCLTSMRGLAFAALLAMSLWLSATAAVADTRPFGSPNLFDPGFVDRPQFLQRPLGHFGVSWE